MHPCCIKILISLTTNKISLTPKLLTVVYIPQNLLTELQILQKNE